MCCRVWVNNPHQSVRNYSVLSVYRGHFTLYNSRNTPSELWGVFRELSIYRESTVLFHRNVITTTKTFFSFFYVFFCQPDEPLASPVTTNRIINVYGFPVVTILLMYVVLILGYVFYWEYNYHFYLWDTVRPRYHAVNFPENLTIDTP